VAISTRSAMPAISHSCRWDILPTLQPKMVDE